MMQQTNTSLTSTSIDTNRRLTNTVSNILGSGASSFSGIVTRSYGVSAPLSTDYPTMRDKELTEKLEETLRKYNVFESDSELCHRMEVLKKINTLFKDWIKKISISKVSEPPRANNDD
jgi:hypothetical protein